MPVAKVRGVNITYRVVGTSGPWMALITGGRRGHDEFIPLAEKIAAKGYRVLLHDRRNTGASDIRIEPQGNESEEAIWTDDLIELLGQLNALPAFIGGSSSGARTSILTYLRHRKDVRGLLLLRVTGGAFAAKRLPPQYYGDFIEAAKTGGMEAVCATPMYQERIAANPSNRDYLMKLDPKKYIQVMQQWLDIFLAGANTPVMGVTDAELKSIAVPTLVIPGNDNTHSSVSGLAAAKTIPGSTLHQLPITDQDRPLIPIEEWAYLEPEIADTFDKFMKKVGAGQKAAE